MSFTYQTLLDLCIATERATGGIKASILTSPEHYSFQTMVVLGIMTTAAVFVSVALGLSTPQILINISDTSLIITAFELTVTRIIGVKLCGTISIWFQIVQICSNAIVMIKNTEIGQIEST